VHIEFNDRDGQPAIAVVGAYSIDTLYGDGHAVIRVYRNLDQVAPNTRPIDSWRFDFGSRAGLPNPDPAVSPVLHATVLQLLARAQTLSQLHPNSAPGDLIVWAVLETAALNPNLSHPIVIGSEGA